MLFQLIPGDPSHPISDHWFGDFDHHPMPSLSNGTALVNLISLNMSAIPGFEGIEPNRLYFPWSFRSDYGVTDTNYLWYGPGGIELLNNSSVEIYGADKPFQPRPLALKPVSPSDVRDLEYRWITGSEPITDYYGDAFSIECCKCGQLMMFLLQLESGGPDNGFCVFDGETLYYGWCQRCRVLAIEPHTS